MRRFPLLSDLLPLIAKVDAQAAIALIRHFGLKGWNVGKGAFDLDGDGLKDPNVYVMYRLRNKRVHPEIGASPDGFIYGAGIDVNENTSIDIFAQKGWRFEGKPALRIGVSLRI